jgi:hypothetical protein
MNDETGLLAASFLEQVMFIHLPFDFPNTASSGVILE